MSFATHVYAVVRIKVPGTNFSNLPKDIAEEITRAVCADSKEWMAPIHGVVQTDHGPFDVEAVEFAEDVSWTMVDEFDKKGDLIREHHFDGIGEEVKEPNGFRSANESRLVEFAKTIAGIDAEKLAGDSAMRDLLKVLIKQAQSLMESPDAESLPQGFSPSRPRMNG